MKRIITVFAAVLLTATATKAQTPEKMSYQAVVRDANNDIVTETPIGMQISILQGAADGTAVYVETQTPTTNANGLVSIEIGGGTVVSGDFSTIDWSAGHYFIKTETDPSGGTNYTITGTSQLLSVPYALHAKTTDGIVGGINYEEIENAPLSTHNDTSYVVSLNKAEKDYVNFGTFSGFTNSSSWAVIERVKMPVGTGADGGWHFFRGYAWGDKEGDIAIQIKSDQVYAWLRKDSWQNVYYNSTFIEDQWYDICLQYNAATATLELFVDGELVGQTTGIAPQDDSANTNNLFWGGQERDAGDLYSEASIVVANQVWLQRTLTAEEIQNYDGHLDANDAVFFSSEINFNSVTDASVNGLDGANGNTPEYIALRHEKISEFSGSMFIDGDLTVTGNLKVGGDLEVGGKIIGSVEVDTIHFSQISGLLGQGYSMIFPQVLDNTVTLEIEGVALTDKVVIVSTIGTETERISTPHSVDSNGETTYLESPGLTQEYPLIFETTNDADMQAVKAWFDTINPNRRNASVVIKDLAGTEFGRWNLYDYIPDGYNAGVDNRIRFTMKHDGLPDNVNSCVYDGNFGAEHSYNPETDMLVEIDGYDCGYQFTPAFELDTVNRTVTLTIDFNEGNQIYNWIKNTISGTENSRTISEIHTTDGVTETERYNYYQCIPIKYEHIYGFGLNTKLKARIVIAYGWREHA